MLRPGTPISVRRGLTARAAGLLALGADGAAGAYGFAMASNYNTRTRAAEVLVAGNGYTVIRDRETLEQLLVNERVAG